MLTYVDIETTGVKPLKDEIVTIQTRSLETPDEPLVIEWAEDRGGERGLLQHFQEKHRFFTNKWKLIPGVWNGVGFELEWFCVKGQNYGLVPFNWNPAWMYTRPVLDLQQFAILCEGDILGTKMSDYTEKKLSGADAAAMAHDRYSLERYIRDETDAWCDLYWTLRRMLPGLMEGQVRPELRRLKSQRDKRKPPTMG